MAPSTFVQAAQNAVALRKVDGTGAIELLNETWPVGRKWIGEYVRATINTAKQTLTLWLTSFTTQRGTAWAPLMAGATLTALPVVIFFVAVQRRIAFGLTAGAVRG